MDVNRKILTYEGIDVCGDRIVDALESEHLSASFSPKITTISFIGYSLGGLINRYVIGKLFAHGHFSHVKPKFFVTIATPHLGVRKRPTSVYNKIFNSLVPVFTSRSGYQLMLTDKSIDEMPLLLAMSLPNLPFFKALSLFKCVLYANTKNDRTVPYTTGSISSSNPYDEKGVIPVTIDPAFPSIVQPQHSDQPPPRSKLRILLIGGLAATSPLLLPIYFLGVFLIGGYSVFQHTKIIKRIKVDYQWVSKFSLQDPTNITNATPSTTSETASLLLPLPKLNQTGPQDPSVRLWIIKQLNTLPLQKFDVLTVHLHAHAAIISRNPSWHKGSEDVVRHLAKRMCSKSE